MYAEIAAVRLVLLYVMAIVSALEAILKTRTAQGAIAWVISLLTFPLISVPLYLIFGRNKFDGYLEKRNAIEAESLRLIQRTSGSVQHAYCQSRTPDPRCTPACSTWRACPRPRAIR